ncbi:hypothetical protein, partial [Pseudomonas gessardii]|uniref:hypothetical protein n=1 Tax=Pseudomonas gessardii TaxID=78544 RepID=UPI0039EB6C21
EALGMTNLNGGTLFNAEFGIRHRAAPYRKGQVLHSVFAAALSFTDSHITNVIKGAPPQMRARRIKQATMNSLISRPFYSRLFQLFALQVRTFPTPGKFPPTTRTSKPPFSLNHVALLHQET